MCKEVSSCQPQDSKAWAKKLQEKAKLHFHPLSSHIQSRWTCTINIRCIVYLEYHKLRLISTCRPLSESWWLSMLFPGHASGSLAEHRCLDPIDSKSWFESVGKSDLEDGVVTAYSIRGGKIDTINIRSWTNTDNLKVEFKNTILYHHSWALVTLTNSSIDTWHYECTFVSSSNNVYHRSPKSQKQHNNNSVTPRKLAVGGLIMPRFVVWAKNKLTKILTTPRNYCVPDWIKSWQYIGQCKQNTKLQTEQLRLLHSSTLPLRFLLKKW